MARDFRAALAEQNPITTPQPIDDGAIGARRRRTFSQVIADATRDLGAFMPTGGIAGANGPTADQRQAPSWRGHYLGKMASPGTLYSHRPLLNANELHAWAQDAGIPNLVPPHEMHVTTIYSRQAVDIAPRTDTVIAKRNIAPLGDKGAVVLHFNSPALQAQHRAAMAAGATHDFPSFLTHVTLSYDAGGKDLSGITPPDFPLVFGPEVHAPINDDWAEEKGLRKGFNPDEPRDANGKWSLESLKRTLPAGRRENGEIVTARRGQPHGAVLVNAGKGPLEYGYYHPGSHTFITRDQAGGLETTDIWPKPKSAEFLDKLDFHAAMAKFNPNHAPAGPDGGQFTSGVGGPGYMKPLATDLEHHTMDDLHTRGYTGNVHAPIKPGTIFHPGGAAFVSPSVEEGKNLTAAVADLGGARQSTFEQASQNIDHELGVMGVNHVGVVGAWADGAENSTMTETLGRDPQTLRLSAAMKGALGNQKAVLVFNSDPAGKSALYDMTVPGSAGQVHEKLLKAGIAFHTLVPQGNRTRVLVVDTGGTMGPDVGHFAVEYKAVAERTLGHAEFIGDTQGTGTAAEQRQRAQNAYSQVIASTTTRYQGRDASQVWKTVSDRWSGRLQTLKGRFYRALAKYNPNHVPGGSPEGGQFDSGTGGIHEAGIHAKDKNSAAAVKAQWIKGSPLKTVDQVYAVSPENKQALDTAGKQIASDLGTTYKAPGIKGRPRVLEKGWVKLFSKIAQGRAPGGVTDIVRATFVTDTPTMADKVVAALGKQFPITDEGWKQTNLGYFDRAVNVRFKNGQIGEVLLAPKALLDAKSPDGGGGHDLYKAWRSLPDGDPGKQRLADAQRQLYGAAQAKLSPIWQSVKLER